MVHNACHYLLAIVVGVGELFILTFVLNLHCEIPFEVHISYELQVWNNLRSKLCGFLFLSIMCVNGLNIFFFYIR